NAANEKAVALFLERKISYLDIVALIEQSMSEHQCIAHPSVEQILLTEQQVYDNIDRSVG
ncbi:MAG: 1-deoxy-D-xylulose-5-phosphate reductoisomerase, partial [Lachnospiraceae bacterium]